MTLLEENTVSEHTPGPWEWKRQADWFVLVGANGAKVCDDGSACGEYGQEIEPDSPDGRLIEAAPDLLAALKRLMGETADMQDALDAAKQARAAIAKCDPNN